jgi:transposase-like protein
MYSYEARIRAAELYIKLGKRVRPTIRQLGYPTKSSLKGWYNEYQRKLDLPMGYAGREPKFSQAQKAAAVEHYLTHDQCIAVTMRALGYPGRGTLTKWVREAFPEVGAVVGRGPTKVSRELEGSGGVELCTRTKLLGLRSQVSWRRRRGSFFSAEDRRAISHSEESERLQRVLRNYCGATLYQSGDPVEASKSLVFESINRYVDTVLLWSGNTPVPRKGDAHVGC